jgi:flavin-binding protein dodecin
MSVAKIVELIGSSTESWEHAAQAAVDEQSRLFVEFVE